MRHRPHPPADERDPLALVRDAVNALYARADIRGDAQLKGLALKLLVDIARRRREAGIDQHHLRHRPQRADA